MAKCLPGDQFVFDANFLTSVPKVEVTLVGIGRELKGIDFPFLPEKKKKEWFNGIV